MGSRRQRGQWVAALSTLGNYRVNTYISPCAVTAFNRRYLHCTDVYQTCVAAARSEVSRTGDARCGTTRQGVPDKARLVLHSSRVLAERASLPPEAGISNKLQPMGEYVYPAAE